MKESFLEEGQYQREDSLPNVSLGGSYGDLEGVLPDYKNMSWYDLLPHLFGPLDLSKVKLSKRTAEKYSAWIRWRKICKGRKIPKKRCWRYKRKVMRIENYNRTDLSRLQQEYRDTIYGKWVFKKKLAKQRGYDFNVTLEEFEQWMLALGNIPNTGIPYWKMTSKNPKYSLVLSRIDPDGPYQKDNLKFTYKQEFLCNVVDLDVNLQ